VAALLAIARRGEEDEFDLDDFEKLKVGESDDEGMEWVELGAKDMTGRIGGGEDLKHLVLWVEIQKQVAILREGMDNERVSAAPANLRGGR